MTVSGRLLENHLNTVLLEKRIPGVDILIGDFDDEQYLRTSFKNVDASVYIAGIEFSPKLVDAAVRCHVRRPSMVHTTEDAKRAFGHNPQSFQMGIVDEGKQ